MGHRSLGGLRSLSLPPRIIFHVDMDAFYVSVERRKDPRLQGKAVIVGADPQGGTARGVVMAASYEAREKGVRSGMPISLAYKRLPEATYLTPDYDTYGEVSTKIIEHLKGKADTLEQLSIDEAFLEVTQKVPTFEAAETYAKTLQEEIQERFGITCSVGIAPNKSIAKIASDMKKPQGITVVPPAKVREFLDPLPVSKISGIGPKTEKMLEERGIKTIGELAAYPGPDLITLLGRNAVWLWGIARGIEEIPVEERPPPKSISVERTFERDVDSWEVILETLDSIAHNVYLRAVDQGVLYRTVGIKIRFEGFDTHLHEETFPSYAREERRLQEHCRALIEEFRGEERKVRLLGVRVSHLLPFAGEQTSLAQWTQKEGTKDRSETAIK